MSEITIIECKNFLRIDFSDDDFFIEMALDCAKSYVCNYCKRTAEDLDKIQEICMAVLVLMDQFYDKSSLDTESETVNYTI